MSIGQNAEFDQIVLIYVIDVYLMTGVVVSVNAAAIALTFTVSRLRAANGTDKFGTQTFVFLILLLTEKTWRLN